LRWEIQISAVYGASSNPTSISIAISATPLAPGAGGPRHSLSIGTAIYIRIRVCGSTMGRDPDQQAIATRHAITGHASGRLLESVLYVPMTRWLILSPQTDRVLELVTKDQAAYICVCVPRKACNLRPSSS